MRSQNSSGVSTFERSSFTPKVGSYASLASLVFGLLLLGTEPAFAGLLITKPAPHQVLAGTSTFSARANGEVDSVEFDLGSLRLGVATHPSFAITWNTGYAADGDYQLAALARDKNGNVLASSMLLFTIRNHGNLLNVMAPDLAGSLSGTVKLSVSALDSQYEPALWIAYIDGEPAAVSWTDRAHRQSLSTDLSVDTVKYQNGIHELYIAVHSIASGVNHSSTWHNWRAGFERLVDIDNGHRISDIAANYLHVYLRPGERTTLSCRQIFTDLKVAPCAGPHYVSSHSSVASVSDSGLVQAGETTGFTAITVADSGRFTRVYVWVRSSPAIPHFSGSGQLLNRYAAGRSLFVVAPFMTAVKEVRQSGALATDLRHAGINTLSQGIFPNPRNVDFDLKQWERVYDAQFRSSWDWSAANGFHLLLTGDDITRRICDDASYILNWPSGMQAVQYAFESTASSGAAIGVEMVDEVNSLWGPTPTPGKSWSGGNCSAPSDWISSLTQSIHRASPTLPISWPVLGIANLSEYQAWEGLGSKSDYASHYWDSVELRHTYPWSAGVYERTHWMAHTFYDRQSSTMIDRPQLLLCGMSACDYTKRTGGAPYYSPPDDELRAPGDVGPTVTSEIMTAAALGAAGVRLYRWESPSNESFRASTPAGSEMSTGANSAADDWMMKRTWDALAIASRAITTTLTPYLLGNALSSPSYGRNIVTAARESGDGRMLMIVNGNDWRHTVAVDFTPFSYAGGQTTRYTISAYALRTGKLESATGETLRLEGGETAVYLFTPAPSSAAARLHKASNRSRQGR